MPIRKQDRVVAKTAAYTITALNDPSGTVFTNRGAVGSVTFTLPPASQAYRGYEYDFQGIADQNLVLAPSTPDTLIVLNDTAADSLAISTGGQKIGGRMKAFCDGTSWIAMGVAVGHTYTIAT